jgi:dipeptidyl aminopeptidase/acylaminoacyl peptidase
MKAQKLGVQVDYYPYPHQKHGVAGAANRVYLYRKILNYFNLYLKPQQ